MRRLLLIFFVLIALTEAKMQVVFCPPGAEWRYSFKDYDYYSVFENERIVYARDSIFGLDTVKVLDHFYFFWGCNTMSPAPTLIKQIGDKIYFWNKRTKQTWQILYDYGALPGQIWMTTLAYGTNYNNMVTYTIVVDSVKTVNVNGFVLRELYVRYLGVMEVHAKITERLGCSMFLFNYDNGSCHTPFFQEFLCYQDNSFGQYQLTSKPCDYSNLAGVSEWDNNQSISVYPNPVAEILRIDLQDMNAADSYVRVTNILGQEIPIGTSNKEREIALDMHEVKNGVYFLQVFDKGKLIATEKIIKE